MTKLHNLSCYALCLLGAALPGFAAPSTTTLASAPNPSRYSQTVTLTATIAGATGGTVTFFNGATTLGSAPVNGSGVATLMLSTLPANPSPHNLTASFSGNGSLDPSTSSGIGHTVQVAATGIHLFSASNRTFTGQPATFTAVVESQAPATATPNGTVNFYDGPGFTLIGTATLNGSGQATLVTSSLSTGSHSLAAEYVGNSNFGSVTTGNFPHTVIDPTLSPLRFVPMAPCRAVDTRNAAGPFGGPAMAANVSRNFTLPGSGCSIPSAAQAYSLNITVVPSGSLGYLSVWPAGHGQPVVSTLNSLDGRIKANAAIVAAGNNGGVSALVTQQSHLIIDINGFFVPAVGSSNLAFYPVTPCRVSDTRNPAGPLGGPGLPADGSRSIPVQSAPCGIPASAEAYVLNMTAVPSGSLGYITTWPTGVSMPVVSTLNALTGAVTANMAIVPAGSGGAISVYASNATHLVVDIMGYFAPPGTGSMDFYAMTPCRISDTRNPAGALGGPAMAANQTRSFPVPTSSCALSGSPKAYSLNATVVPQPTLGYLTLWGSGAAPVTSTLNSLDGSIVSNATLIRAGVSGEVTAFTTHNTHLILDIGGYFQ